MHLLSIYRRKGQRNIDHSKVRDRLVERPLWMTLLLTWRGLMLAKRSDQSASEVTTDHWPVNRRTTSSRQWRHRGWHFLSECEDMEPGFNQSSHHWRWLRGCFEAWVEQVEPGLTSHQTHYRSYRGRVFTGQMTQPTVSKHRRKTQL